MMGYMSAVGVILLLIATGAAFSSLRCPFGCSCNSRERSVICRDIHDNSLERLLLDIPEDTYSLEVISAEFQPTFASSLPSKQDIQSIRPSHRSYPKLNILRLQDVSLQSVEEAFLEDLPSLRELHLEYNEIQELHADSFQGLDKLEVLNMSYNQLSAINDTALYVLQNLQVLDLSHNNLTTLPQDILTEQDSLQEINLGHNSLGRIPHGSFMGYGQLRLLNLEGNHLEMLHPELLDNLTSLTTLVLQNNPWQCTCVVDWLHKALLDSAIVFPNKNSIVCDTPEELHSRPLTSLAADDLECDFPEFDTLFEDHDFMYLQSYALHCNATGDPTPSVYWITPRGIVAHPDHQLWIPHELDDVQAILKYAGQPTYYEATVVVDQNGSLLFHNFRNFFAGAYTCVAQNPAGFVNATVHIKTGTPIPQIEIVGLTFGAMTAAGFLVLSLIMASIRLCIVHVCFKKKFKHLPSGITMEITDQEEEDLARMSPYLFRWSPYQFDHGSPDFSPIKCVTPAEADDAEQNFDDMNLGIMEMLEDVRATLWMGMGRQVDRIRNRAHYMRQSSSRYVQNIRVSGSNYVNTLRESGSKKMGRIRETSSRKVRSIRASSSQYANRVRTGVVLSVESVKYHVQSMKEYCGTGEISHTVSTVSFSTDVDSNERTEVVRTITYV